MATDLETGGGGGAASNASAGSKTSTVISPPPRRYASLAKKLLIPCVLVGAIWLFFPFLAVLLIDLWRIPQVWWACTVEVWAEARAAAWTCVRTGEDCFSDRYLGLVVWFLVHAVLLPAMVLVVGGICLPCCDGDE